MQVSVCLGAILIPEYLAPVVQRLDNAIQWISVDKTNHAIHGIVIYPVDSIIHFSNNRDLDSILAILLPGAE